MTTEKVNEMLEKQLETSNKQINAMTKQIESLTQQVQVLTKLLYGSKTEQSKYNLSDGQGSLFDDGSSFNDSEHTEKQSTAVITYTVTRKKQNKKRNDSFSDFVEIEEVHHHPKHTSCDSCQNELMPIGSKLIREEAKFIPAIMKRVQHIEHAYDCLECRKNKKQVQIQRGKAPTSVLQRSLAGPTVLSKVIYDKYCLYLPLYRQVKEWEPYGLLTNDKNLSNWVIRSSEEILEPIYRCLKTKLMQKTILHVDETYGKVIHRSDGKSGQSKAYNWLFKSSPSQGPVIIIFHSSLSRSRLVLEEMTKSFNGTIICDGYSAYNNFPNITFGNCWAHVRRYWLNVESIQGKHGVAYCDKLYRLERKFKQMKPSKRRKARQKYSLPIVEEFFHWVDTSPFFGKSAIAKAANYTLNRQEELKVFLDDGRIELDNNPAENAIRPNVIGRKNWLFSVSEAGAKANAVCLSLAETAKANGVDFYAYLVKLFSDLPNINFYQQPELLENYMPWSKNIQATCAK